MSYYDPYERRKPQSPIYNNYMSRWEEPCKNTMTARIVGLLSTIATYIKQIMLRWLQ